MDPLFQIPEDLGALDLAGLQAFIDAATARLSEVGESPSQFLNDDRSFDQLKTEVTEAIAAVKEARALAAAFEAEETPAEPEAETPAEPEAETPAEEPEAETPAEPEAPADEPTPEETEAAAEPEAVVASVTPPRRPASAPARSRAAAPVETTPMVPLTAAAGAGDRSLGSTFESMTDLAKTMIKRRLSFGNNMPDGAENVTIAVADWTDQYPEGRKLIGLDEEATSALIASVVSEH